MRTLRISIVGKELGRLEQSILSEHATVIGRHSGEVTIPSPLCSRIHAQIIVVDNRIFIEDLGSKNGIRVNGFKRTGRFELQMKDQIEIGRHIITLLRWQDSERETFETNTDQFDGEFNESHIVMHEEPWDNTFN